VPETPREPRPEPDLASLHEAITALGRALFEAIRPVAEQIIRALAELERHIRKTDAARQDADALRAARDFTRLPSLPPADPRLRGAAFRHRGR
jgi:uncharacterized membrane protein YccC